MMQFSNERGLFQDVMDPIPNDLDSEQMQMQ